MEAKKNVDVESRINWWREAKFGMFIHWGLYAIPAGEWKGQPFSGIGEWLMFKARIPVADYEELAKEFNPVQFDADAWAQLAFDAGMKYLVITAKHHDGFSMFKSEVSPYNIVDATPFKRDPVQELATACARRGLKFGVYYSQAQDWHEPGGAIWDTPHEGVPRWEHTLWDSRQKGEFDEYLVKKAIPQVKELLSNYGPFGIVWFDTPLKVMTVERAEQLERAVHELQPDALVSGRLGGQSQSDYDSEGDNCIPNAVREGDWETPATLNDTWGFKKDDNNWKKPEDLIFKLVDIASKGGNYLLNVGPDAEGLIPLPSREMLREVGKWLQINGEAIYGAGPTPFGSELGSYSETGKDRDGNPAFNMLKDWRCTTRPGKLYIHLFTWPGNTLTLTDMPVTVTKASLLGEPQYTSLPISQLDGTLSVELPESQPHPIATVLRLELDDSGH